MEEKITSISELHGIELIDDKDLNILSVGISTAGAAEIEMAKRNPNVNIIATTLDEKGIKDTEKKILEQGLSERIQLKIEDISQKLTYHDEMFHYVYARLVLHYLDNEQLKNALSEIYRILAKEGKLYVVVRSENAWEAKLEGSSFDKITGLTRHPDLRTYGTDHVNYCYRRLHSVQSIKDFLVEAGFQVKYTKVYDEYLSIDYNRKQLNDKPSELIEVLAIKK